MSKSIGTIASSAARHLEVTSTSGNVRGARLVSPAAIRGGGSPVSVTRGGHRLQPSDRQDLLLIERVVFQQGPRKGFQLGSVFGQESRRFNKAFIRNALDFGVNLARRCLAVGPRQAEPIARAILPEGKWSDFRAHAPGHHHLVSDRRDLLKVARGSG